MQPESHSRAFLQHARARLRALQEEIERYRCPPAFLALVHDPAKADQVEELFAATRPPSPLGLPLPAPRLERLDWPEFRARSARAGARSVLVVMPEMAAADRAELLEVVERWAGERGEVGHWMTDSPTLLPCICALPGSAELLGEGFLPKLIGNFATPAGAPKAIDMYVEDITLFRCKNS